MSYTIVTLKNDELLKDAHHSQLWDLGASGIEETDDHSIAYFLTSVDQQKFETIFSASLISIVLEEDQNWMENWKDSFKPQYIGDKFIVKPTWEKVDSEDKIVIDIDPKMAFGTGTHETTQLVLMLLPKYSNNVQDVFDFGTGSGVLSIAAEKLGCKEILAIDNDEDALINANENIQLNSCKHIILNKMGLHSIDKSFNLILANINKLVLLSEAKNIINKLKNDGVLIVSGLLAEHETDIRNKYAQLEFIEKKQKNEWIAMVFKK